MAWLCWLDIIVVLLDVQIFTIIFRPLIQIVQNGFAVSPAALVKRLPLASKALSFTSGISKASATASSEATFYLANFRKQQSR